MSPATVRSRYPRIILKPDREASLLRGHPWIFSGAVASVEGSPEPGDIAAVSTHGGDPLGLGFYNPRSDIIFRLLTTDATASIDQQFWQQRIRSSLSLRKKIVPEGTTACRLINAEGDGMPGLVVDRYNEYLVFAIATAGMERERQSILRILQEEIRPSGIYERSEGRARQSEGLVDRIGPARGNAPPDTVEITENHLLFTIDIATGQKTGFFLDQRHNRELIERLSSHATVLNCFAYTGAFSAYSIRGGARRVISVEISAAAGEMARQNLQRNGYSPEDHPIIRSDAFTFLRETRETFDMIILDPPAFAKAKKDVAKSSRGYKDINLHAVNHLKDGGILVTFSCSNYIDTDLFQKIVLSAVRDAGKTAQLLQTLGPGPDHPTNLAHPEGRYLKGLLLCVNR
ncbi:MAG: class I SAM-dependent rRNA methyltransferase [Deltaproteobacteria bacterium]|nr:class I SAM-dependent rRNA methyltransferase [Deltaproteobacteria bacterium]